jgi:hypothetical protein
MASSARLQYSLKTLREHWNETTEQWDDKVSQDFEKNHLVPLEQLSNNAIRGIDEIAELISKIRRDCS